MHALNVLERKLRNIYQELGGDAKASSNDEFAAINREINEQIHFLEKTQDERDQLVSMKDE
jgi:hypothetical protein